MKLHAPRLAALSLTLLVSAHAQTPFTDPANLRGERITPKTGRELPVDGGAPGLQQLLRKLSTRASLMLIVAHPDDEDGGMLTYYSRGQGARVADLSLTRGEGGQNAVTGDFEDALGLIRTQELLAADRYFGADQFFGTEVDFGFSKTKQEAFAKWTHERVLYDTVRAVRLYRPLVLAAVFIGGVTDGHGQHQVSGEIAQEVFKAAADPTLFPELTAEGILPWAPLKVYARVPTYAITDKGLFDYATNQYTEPTFTNYVTGQTSTVPPTADVIIHEGQTDPLLTDAAANPADLPNSKATPTTQLSYVQFARLGLGLQRTQIGPGFRTAPSGTFDINYHLYGSRLCGAPNSVIAPEAKSNRETCIPPAPPTGKTSAHQSASFYDGVDISLEGIASLIHSNLRAATDLASQLAGLAAKINQATTGFTTSQQASAAAPPLAEALTLLNGILQSSAKLPVTEGERSDLRHELLIKRVQLNEALTFALGIQFDTTLDAENSTSPKPSGASRASVVQGSIATVTTHFNTGSGAALERLSILAPQMHAKARDWNLSAGPYPAHQTQTFQDTIQLQQSAPPTRPYFSRHTAEQPVYDLDDSNLRNAPATPSPFIAQATAAYKGVQVELASAVTTSTRLPNGTEFASPLSIIPPSSLSQSSHAEVLPDGAPAVTTTATLVPPQQTPLTPQLTVPAAWKVTSEPTRSAAPGQTVFRITAPSADRHPITAKASVKLPGNGTLSEGFLPVGYPGLVYTNFYTPATTRIVPVDLKLPTHRRIAYLPGTGDAVADNLRSVGFEVTDITLADLNPDHLAYFDTVILGVRTYNAHPDLHGARTQALLDFVRAGGNVIVQYQTAEFTADDAPYPLTLGNAEKVVDESAPVRLLDPSSPALTSPNHITAADFNGWIEERGHGFLRTWDPRYTALTETHDPGVPAEHVAPQLPQEGGLITTSLGRGHWTYVAFALYRQLPEAVPGAFRLFTNLLALADQR